MAKVDTEGDYVVHRGDTIIADGLDEKQTEKLLYELQAICGENE